MTTNPNRPDVQSMGRRGGDRRKSQVPFEGADRRVEERRSGDDRRRFERRSALDCRADEE